MALDTVAIAQTTPDNSQPFAELGLKPDEYARIKEILGRRPTSSELAMHQTLVLIPQTVSSEPFKIYRSNAQTTTLNTLLALMKLGGDQESP